MASYIIGDVHGCLKTLHRLLEVLEYDAKRDRIFLTGDLVNAGPDSAGVVRWARDHQAAAVLGNHDFHLLAVAAGVRPPRKSDTFYDLLEADDREELLDWLRERPLLIEEERFVLVHAGLLPEWTVATAVGLAEEVAQFLRSDPSPEFLEKIFGDEPRRWKESLTGMDRARVTVNAMTRLRMLTSEGALDLDYKGPPGKAPSKLQPWFSFPGRLSADTPVFFGHWAALGFHRGAHAIGLDSGCAWGGELTAWRVEDDAVFQVPSELRRA